MLSLQEIRDDLREIRYYYGMKDLFDQSSKTVKPLAIIEKVNRYNSAIEKASARLYALYVSLYINNNSQVTVAEDWNLTKEQIKNKNRQLLEYLQSALK